MTPAAVHAQPGTGRTNDVEVLQLPLSGPAYAIAEEAYAAYAKGEYDIAVTKAREAIRQRPDVDDLKLLLVGALEASGQLKEAEQQILTFFEQGTSASLFGGHLSRIRQQLANEPAQAALKALRQGDVAEAVRNARIIVDLAPSEASYRLLLIDALLKAQEYSEAEAAATAALENDPEDVSALVLRAYVRTILKNFAAAGADLDLALGKDWLTAREKIALQFIAAQSALVAGDVSRARTIVDAIDRSDGNVENSVRVLRGILDHEPPRLADVQGPNAPIIQCDYTLYGVYCQLLLDPAAAAPRDAGYAAASEAHEAYNARDFAKATAKAREAIALVPENPAYRELLANAIAGDVYADHAKGNYVDAVAKAREALRQQPDLDRLKVLLVNALEAADDIEQAEQEARAFVEAGSSSPELSGLLNRLRGRLAQKPAAAAYRAFAEGRIDKAVQEARRAVALAPDVHAYHLLLISTLLRKNDLSAAEAAATAALDNDDEDVVSRVLRAYARQKLGRIAPANEDFDKSLAVDWLADNDLLTIRLIAIDAAIAAGDYKRARALLAGVDKTAKEAGELSKQIEAASSGRSGRARSTFAQPLIDCRLTPYGQACSLVRSTTPELVVDPAVAAATNAYQALERGDVTAAIRYARLAVRNAPNNLQYRELLINVLVAGKQVDAAIGEIDRAMGQFGASSMLLRQRGYLRMQAGQPERAIDDFARALALTRNVAERRTLALALADAALAAKQPERALEALAAIGGSDSYAVVLKRGQVLQALKRNEEALEAFQQAAALAPTPAEKARAIAAQTGALVDLGRRSQARALFADAYAAGQFDSLPTLELAYLAVRAGDNPVAFKQFSQAQARGELRGLPLIDAAHAARSVYDNPQAIEWLKTAIDSIGDTLEPQYLFGLRREVAELSRTWGAYVSLSHGAVGVMPGLPYTPQPGGGTVTQVGSEIYWRPPVIGYRDGAVFDLFVRSFTTLHSSLGGPVGFSTMQGSFGARWKPFRDYNVVIEAARLFRIGNNSREDTMVRLAFSESRGTDLRVDVPSWWMGTVYGEVGRYFDARQTFSTLEARGGRSFRIDAISDRLVITPFLAVGASFDNLLATKWAVGAGPGLNARYWFREDKYTAPMSYVDLNVQYRFKVHGDERAEGLFAGLTMAY